MAKLMMCSKITRSLLALLIALSFLGGVALGGRILIEGDKSSIQPWPNEEHPMSTRKMAVQVTMDDENLHFMRTIEFDGMEDSDGDEHVIYSKIKSATRTSARGGREVLWQGVLEGDGIGFATFVQSAQGHMSGTFSTGRFSYSLITSPDGSTHVQATTWSNFPDSEPDDPPPSPEIFALDASEDLDLGNVSVVKYDHERFVPEPWQQDPETKSKTEDLPHNRALRGRQPGAHRTLEEIIEVDVLVIVTNRAMCEYAGLKVGCPVTDANRAPMESALAIAQEQTNEAMSTVGIPVETRTVNIAFLEGTFDGRPTKKTLNVMLSDANIAKLRTDAGADLVVMITDFDRKNCGLAYLNMHVSAISYTCLGSYTYTHELGHCFGANHDRNNVQAKQLHPYGHGFQFKGSRFPYRTLMSYQCPGGCPAVPYFSNKDFVFTSGLPLGDEEHDNARLITENAPRVRDWMNRVEASPVVPVAAASVALPITPPDSPPEKYLTSPEVLPETASVALQMATPNSLLENFLSGPEGSPVTVSVDQPMAPPDSPPNEYLSCPASSECPGLNLLNFQLGGCLEVCASEGSFYLGFLETIGYKCGGCP